MKKIEIIFLITSLVCIAFLHSYYFTELYYDRDLAFYAYNSLNILEGHDWYSNWGDPKPPGINLIILAAFSLIGKSFKSIYWAALFFNLLSVFSLYLFAKLILSKEVRFYFFLPFFFILFFGSEVLKTYSANTEVFLATFEIAGMLFLGLNQYLISGLLLGLGFLIRQTGLFTFIAGVIFLIALKMSDKTSFRLLIKNLAIFFAAFTLPLILISAYFLYKGIFNKFLNITFISNLRYSAEYLINIRQRDLFFTKKLLWNGLSFEIILFSLFSLFGLFYAFIIRRTKISLFIGIWFLVICAGLLITGIYPHHFVQIIAPLSCISLLGVSAMFEEIKVLFKNKVYLRIISIGILIVVLFIPYVRLGRPFITKERPVWYAHGAEDRFHTASYIKEHTAPEDRIFVWDNFDSGAIYLWSERRNATIFSSKATVLPSELIEYWVRLKKDFRIYQKKLLVELHQKLPKYIILVSDYRVVIDKTGAVMAEAKDFNIERNVFSEFFQVLDKEYLLEKNIGACSIYRIKN